MKRGAASLAAKIKQQLNVTPLMQEGKPGELSIYVGDERVPKPGILARTLGLGMNAWVANLGKKLVPAK